MTMMPRTFVAGPRADLEDFMASPLTNDTVEKLRKRIAVKFRPNDILSENRCSMPPQCGYGGRLLLQRQ
ncbi:MAG: hypothetical protein WCC90_20045, partial [Methylocella sp.]